MQCKQLIKFSILHAVLLTIFNKCVQWFQWDIPLHPHFFFLILIVIIHVFKKSEKITALPGLWKWNEKLYHYDSAVCITQSRITSCLRINNARLLLINMKKIIPKLLGYSWMMVESLLHEWDIFSLDGPVFAELVNT